LGSVVGAGEALGSVEGAREGLGSAGWGQIGRFLSSRNEAQRDGTGPPRHFNGL
jgi:hypothetical protein